MSKAHCVPWQNCPNRYSRGRANNFDDCDRCGSEKHNTNVRFISASYSIVRLFVSDPRFRNAPLFGDCMTMLPIVNARRFSSFENQGNHLLSARVGRGTSQLTSGATIAQTLDTLVTYVRQKSHGDAIAYENNFGLSHRIAKRSLAHTTYQTRRLPLACGTCSRDLSLMPLSYPCGLARRATGKTGKPSATAGAQTRQ
jgi:hypothetical protein